MAEFPDIPPLTLVAVRVSSQPRPGRRDEPCFSALFRAPVGVFAPQQTYLLEHRTLGRVAIFLVPVAPDAQGPLFQAVFA